MTMLKTRFKASLLAAAALPAGLAAAVTASTTAEAQQRAQRPPAELTIINARGSALTAFEIATSGEQPRLVGKLGAPLAPGKSVKMKLTRPAGCSYFVLARFDDGSENDAEDVNLCGERQIRLTE
jgi:hypothetical protein